MLKTCFKREEAKHFIYRDYKNFNDVNSRMGLENELEECPKHYENSEKTFANVSDAHAPRKTKVLRGNHKPHVNKNLRYLDNTETSKNSKPFWNECKPYFSNKHAHGDSKIILIEKEEITTNSNEVIKK